VPSKTPKRNTLKKQQDAASEFKARRLEELQKKAWDTAVKLEDYPFHYEHVECNEATNDTLLKRRFNDINSERRKEHKPVLSDDELASIWIDQYYLPEQRLYKQIETVVIPNIEMEIIQCNESITDTEIKLSEYEKSQNPKTRAKIKPTRNSLRFQLARKEILEWEKLRVPLFHRHDSVVSIRVDGDQNKEHSWKYTVVYRNNNGYFEAQVSKEWLQENFDTVFLKALKQNVQLGDYLICDEGLLRYTAESPFDDDIIEDVKSQFGQLWEYKDKINDDRVWYVRAITRIKLVSNKEIEVKKKSSLPVFAREFVVPKKIKWAYYCSSFHANNPPNHIYRNIDESYLEVVVGVETLGRLKANITRWQEADTIYRKVHPNENNKTRTDKKRDYYPESDNRFIDGADSDNFFAFLSDREKNVEDRDDYCVESGLGLEEFPQVYYWDFKDTTNDREIFYNVRTYAQISGIKYDDVKKNILVWN
jgi:hypothetical protein